MAVYTPQLYKNSLPDFFSFTKILRTQLWRL